MFRNCRANKFRSACQKVANEDVTPLVEVTRNQIVRFTQKDNECIRSMRSPGQ
jgi:hypothetical protein